MPPPRKARSGYDIAIVGGGIAGLTAAWHAGRRGMAAVLIEGSALFGGQVANVDAVEGYPLPAPTSGTELATALVDKARALGVGFVQEPASGMTGEVGSFRVEAGPAPLRARRIVVASGCRLRQLGVSGEAALLGRGVSQCAPCDGPLFRDEDVVVVGGGDAAAQEALVLVTFCRSVTLVCRGALRAKRELVDRLTASPKLRFEWDSEVEAIEGETGVTGVRLRNRKDGTGRHLACTGVFPFIGGDPVTGFLPHDIQRSNAGRLATDSGLRTSIPGIYAVGAVRKGYSGELADAAGDGAAVIATIAADMAQQQRAELR